MHLISQKMQTFIQQNNKKITSTFANAIHQHEDINVYRGLLLPITRTRYRLGIIENTLWKIDVIWINKDSIMRLKKIFRAVNWCL